MLAAPLDLEVLQETQETQGTTAAAVLQETQETQVIMVLVVLQETQEMQAIMVLVVLQETQEPMVLAALAALVGKEVNQVLVLKETLVEELVVLLADNLDNLDQKTEPKRVGLELHHHPMVGVVEDEEGTEHQDQTFEVLAAAAEVL